MKPDTIVKRLKDIVDEGLVPFSEKLIQEGNDECIDLCNKVVENLIEAKKLFAQIEDIIKKAQPPPGTVKRPGRINNKSLRVWKRDNYTCQVCEHKDETGETLGRAGLIGDPKDDDDYITLCKNHLKEYKVLKPWTTRTDDRKDSLKVLLRMAESLATQEK